MAQTREAALAYLAGQLAGALMQQTGDANIAIATSERINAILSPAFGEDPYPPDGERPTVDELRTVDRLAHWTNVSNTPGLEGIEMVTAPYDNPMKKYIDYLWLAYDKAGHMRNDGAARYGDRILLNKADLRQIMIVRVRGAQ